MNGIKLAIKKQHGGEVVPMGWPILLAPRLLPGKAVLSWVSRVAARYDLVPSQLSFGLRAPGLARAHAPDGRQPVIHLVEQGLERWPTFGRRSRVHRRPRRRPCRLMKERIFCDQ